MWQTDEQQMWGGVHPTENLTSRLPLSWIGSFVSGKFNTKPPECAPVCTLSCLLHPLWKAIHYWLQLYRTHGRPSLGYCVHILSKDGHIWYRGNITKVHQIDFCEEHTILWGEMKQTGSTLCCRMRGDFIEIRMLCLVGHIHGWLFPRFGV